MDTRYHTKKKSSYKSALALNLTDFPLAGAPPLELDKWNATHVISKNNCYNYACNIMTSTLAQPGRGSGTIIIDPIGGGEPITFRNIEDGIVGDGLIPVSSSRYDRVKHHVGHYIALVVSPYRDFHFYRLDNNGKWSHKLGTHAATNLDDHGHLINDPKNCARDSRYEWRGYYFCIISQMAIL